MKSREEKIAECKLGGWDKEWEDFDTAMFNYRVLYRILPGSMRKTRPEPEIKKDLSKQRHDK